LEIKQNKQELLSKDEKLKRLKKEMNI